MNIWRLSVLVLSIAGAHAQNGSQLKDWKPSGETWKSKMACAGLRSLTGYDYSILTAVSIPPTVDAPEYCRVTGQIIPEVLFEVSLPSEWNGRLYMFGNGGYAGESLEAAGRVAHRARALRQGFAVAQTNTGHDSAVQPLGTFAVDRQKLIDYAFRAVHVTAETAKRVAGTYYARPPSRSYFDGCSTGGRQGLMSAQRFPADFDGIVVGAPVLDFTQSMMNFVWINQALASGPVPFSKFKLLSEKIYAHCDTKDGLADGVIDDPRKCGFSPVRDLPRCAAGADGSECFTEAQALALEKIYTGSDKGVPGWPVGAEIAPAGGRPGWFPWFVRDDGQPTLSTLFADTFFRYLAFPEKDPKWELARFDFDKDPARLAGIRSILDATDPDLTSFRDRGGKIVMYYGWAEPSLNPLMGVSYYENMARRMGGTSTNFFRLFMVPGMFHCAGGVGTGTFDALTPLVDWVENGKAPAQIAASRIVDNKTVRTRPLCPYPQVAKYKGTGSIDEAANFTCSAP